MTVKEAIAAADKLRQGNRFTEADKYRWINLCEAAIQREVLLMHEPEAVYVPVEDADEKLLAPPPYDELYVQWLCAKMDEAQAQYEIYSNTIDQFNRTVQEFAKWVIKRFDPKHNPVGVRADVTAIIRGTPARLYLGNLPLTANECSAGSVMITQGETVMTITVAGEGADAGVAYSDDTVSMPITAAQTLAFDPGSAFVTWRLTDAAGNVYSMDIGIRIKFVDPGHGVVAAVQEG